jgi:hypothetical protein
VFSFANNHDPMRALDGEPTIDPRTVGGGKTTFGAITAGVNIKTADAKASGGSGDPVRDSIRPLA